MGKLQLSKDPYNIIITGVGGQGNVLGSRVLSNMLVRKGYYATIGETFGASQRGGSVMSHIRVSAKSTWRFWSIHAPSILWVSLPGNWNILH
jgi:indolepyruvate ferredoxin oxidoreductase beta subunit